MVYVSALSSSAMIYLGTEIFGAVNWVEMMSLSFQWLVHEGQVSNLNGDKYRSCLLLLLCAILRLRA